MVKSFNHLWPKITSWNNLVRAYQKCRRHKRYKRPATEFDFSGESNQLEFQRDLLSDKYRPRDYSSFYIIEPKRRKISAAPFRDRVVHHALVNVLEPLFERRFIFDSYACRRGKGTHRAIKRSQYYLRKHPWCLKTDIVKFFPNIDHIELLRVIGKTVRDEATMGLIRRILHSGEGLLSDEATPHFFEGDDLFSVLRPKGLPIGNLTSQFFANVFLDPIDHFIKEDLRVPGYVRYADDLLLFGDSKAQLWQWQTAITELLEDWRLLLHKNKTHVLPTHCGINFLGMRVFQNGLRFNQNGIRRFNSRVKRFRWLKKRGAINPARITASIRAWLSYARFANTAGIREAIWRRLKF